MQKMTEENLKAAFAGESQAHMKYINFAEKARKENLPNIARLFEATAYAERVHASNHLRALGGLQDTTTNLVAAKSGEDFEIGEMYPAYIAVAREQGEDKALRPMNWALEAEKNHSVLYGAAREKAEAKQDISAVDIWVCDVCGYTVEGDVPDVCPICGVKHEKFSKF
ncbi:MAG: rubrerythrin family protein [Anaerolineae bacterium]|nr:rubrerythrin family protein [Anaerolineae bacterium]